MSPHESSFLKKPPLSNLSSNCSESVSVTIKIIKHKTQSDKPVRLTPPWDSVQGLLAPKIAIASGLVGAKAGIAKGLLGAKLGLARWEQRWKYNRNLLFCILVKYIGMCSNTKALNFTP